MERPDINSKKYTYFHKKLNKKMFNNQKYLEDCKKFFEQASVLPQADVSISVCLECGASHKSVGYGGFCSNWCKAKSEN